MNIYFACSITGGRDFEAVYQTITKALAEDCHEVPTAHLAETGVTALEAVIDPLEVYSRDVAWNPCQRGVDCRGECSVAWCGL